MQQSVAAILKIIALIKDFFWQNNCHQINIMSEMLGNHYFQLKNYFLAEQSYEKEFLRGSSENRILKRLIICYTQTNKIPEAQKLLLQLIEQDINIVLKTNINEEFCPCDELIVDIENGVIKYESNFDTYCVLGILWLFCNYENSLKYFQLASKEQPSDEIIAKILNLIKDYPNQIKFKQSNIYGVRK